MTTSPNRNKHQELPRGVSYSEVSARGVPHARLNICWHDTEKRRKFTLHLGIAAHLTEPEYLLARNAAAAFRAEYEKCRAQGVCMDPRPWHRGKWREAIWPEWEPEKELPHESRNYSSPKSRTH